MAKIKLNNKTRCKKSIHLDECQIGTLIRLNGSYFIYPDYDFDNCSAEIGLLNLADGGIYFFNDNTEVEVYDGEINLDEEKFRQFS